MSQIFEIDYNPFRWWAVTPRGFAPVVDDPCDDWGVYFS